MKITSFTVDDEVFTVFDDIDRKSVRSKSYNTDFDKRSGFFSRWGKNKEDDPVVAPAIEIMDIEIVSGGNCLGKCKFCYKCNNLDNELKYMNLETFKKVFTLLPKALGQIAFGITNIYANPDFFKIMEYTRENGVIPNYTTHGLDVDENAVKKTAKLCGAVAVSIVNKEKSYDAIKSFTDAGMTQVNCHYMLSEETYDRAFSIIDDIKTDPRLAKLNAIVFLQYKDKNPYANYHSMLDVEKYRKLFEYCQDKGVGCGFDSCSAGIFIESVKNRADANQLEQCCDSCESGRMSFYLNTLAEAFPCSFCEGTEGWEKGINLLECNDFVKDVWFHPRTVEWRKKLIGTMKNGCAECPIYNLKMKN